MRTFVAMVFGFLSGAMLFILGATLTSYTISSGPTLAVACMALLGGWAISAHFIRWNAATTSAVMCRGFLLGAAEWLAVIPATRTPVKDHQNLSNAVPAVVGEVVIRWLSVGMASGCLIAFCIAYFLGRQKRAYAPPASTAPPHNRAHLPDSCIDR